MFTRTVYIPEGDYCQSPPHVKPCPCLREKGTEGIGRPNNYQCSVFNVPVLALHDGIFLKSVAKTPQCREVNS